MKKVVALLITLVMCISVCSCGLFNSQILNQHAIALSAEKQEVNYNDFKDEGYKSFLEKIQSFSSKLTAELTKKYGQNYNYVISPLSVYMALSLACECAANETRQEILDAVGVSYDEVNKYARILYAFANEEYGQYNAITDNRQIVAQQILNNSIWLDDSVEFIREGVDKLSYEYNCDVYQASFKNGEADRLIGKYIESKSKGILDGKVDFSPETYFVLMNTYYLKEIWNEYGRNLSFTDEPINFQNSDGSFKQTKLLEGYYNDGKVYNGDRFESFFTQTEHGFKIYFFLPDDEWSVQSIFTEENIDEVLKMKDWGHVDDENRQLHYTRVLFPEFEADFDDDIADVLSEKFGIKKLFDPDECDMSNITSDPVYCEGVIHKVSLTVDKKGIEGAAVVYIPGAGAAGPPPYEKVYHDFTVTGAFGFVITDTYGTVVFSGVINTLD